MNRIKGVISYWEYKESKWVLVESYPIDDDGYSLVPTSTGGGKDRHEWNKWLFAKDDEEDESDPIPIMGRAVTVWSMAGVGLMGFNPPEWTKWISSEFYSELKKIPNWWKFLQDGYTLYLGTMDAAEKIILDERSGQIPK